MLDAKFVRSTPVNSWAFQCNFNHSLNMEEGRTPNPGFETCSFSLSNETTLSEDLSSTELKHTI